MTTQAQCAAIGAAFIIAASADAQEKKSLKFAWDTAQEEYTANCIDKFYCIITGSMHVPPSELNAQELANRYNFDMNNNGRSSLRFFIGQCTRECRSYKTKRHLTWPFSPRYHALAQRKKRGLWLERFITTRTHTAIPAGNSL